MSDAAHLGPFLNLMQSVLAQGGMKYDQGSNKIAPIGGAPAAPAPPISGAPPAAAAPPVSPTTGTAGSTTVSSGGGGGGGYTPYAALGPGSSGMTPTSLSFTDMANNVFAGN